MSSATGGEERTRSINVKGIKVSVPAGPLVHNRSNSLLHDKEEELQSLQKRRRQLEAAFSQAVGPQDLHGVDAAIAQEKLLIRHLEKSLHPNPGNEEEEGDDTDQPPIKYKSVKDCDVVDKLTVVDLPSAHIHQAHLLEVNSLSKTFAPANVHNLSAFSTTTSGEEIAYNKLLGHTDGVIADLVRRAGMPHETKVYVRAGRWVGSLAVIVQR